MILTLVFTGLLLLGVLVRMVLAYRHSRSIVAHRGQVPAAFAQHMPLEAHQRAADYTQSKVWTAWYAETWQLASVVVLTLGGLLGWMQTWVAGHVHSGLLAGLALVVLVSVFEQLVGWPFALYQVFGLEARYGFNRMTWRMYVLDGLKGLAVSAVLGLPLLALVLWMMQALGSHWWWAVWLVWSGFQLLMLLVYPTWIAPLFNRFTPLEEGELKSRIEALLARCGFKAQGVMVMDGSRRSSHGNAYFTGLGRSKRIVLFDTLINQLSVDELEAVLAHELGHFRHRHLAQRLALSLLVSLGLLALLGWLADKVWFYQAFGVDALLQRHASLLVLFMLVLPVLLWPLKPLMGMWSRRHEYQADAFAVAQNLGPALASGLVKLYRDNAATLTPDAWYSAYHDSHPPAPLRVARLPGWTAPTAAESAAFNPAPLETQHG